MSKKPFDVAIPTLVEFGTVTRRHWDSLYTCTGAGGWRG
jgi:hypothetical protein